MGPTLESRVSPVPWAVAVFLVWAAAGSCVDRRARGWRSTGAWRLRPEFYAYVGIYRSSASLKHATSYIPRKRTAQARTAGVQLAVARRPHVVAHPDTLSHVTPAMRCSACSRAHIL